MRICKLKDRTTIDLAKKEDDQDIEQDIHKTNSRVAEMATSMGAAHQNIDHIDNRIAILEKRASEMEHQPAGSTTRWTSSPTRMSNRTSTGSTTTAAEDEWRLRIIHWRGWAPYGAGASSKLTKAEAENLQRDI